MVLDSVSETIAHFIGLFELTHEEARLREAHDAFRPLPEAAPAVPDVTPVTVDVPTAYTLEDYVPGIAYTPIPPVIEPVSPYFVGMTEPLHGPVGAVGALMHAVDLAIVVPAGSATLSVSTPMPAPDLPGSIDLAIHQVTSLVDNDVAHVGGTSFDFAPLHDYASMLGQLVAAARLDLPLGSGDPPSSNSAIKEAILSTPEATESLHHQAEATGMSYYLTDAASLKGVTVDGVATTAAPQLKDHMPVSPAAPETPTSSGGALSMVDHGTAGGGALTLDSGANTLVNTAVLANGHLAAPVFAILGDHFETNTIVQMNVWSDHDFVGGALAATVKSAPTEGFNIAAFSHVDPTAGQAPINPATAASSQGWHVDTLKGDLVSVNWISQVNFVSDSDVATYSSTGATTWLTMGSNAGVNAVSFADLGHYYDLVIVGGSYLSASSIAQTNVLLDNDVVTGLNGFQTSGTASVSTGGNLLWNAAEITHVGASDRFQALPDSFRTAAADLAAGKTSMPHDLATDPAFAGYAGLHVLYISGDVLQLQMISQTNVLGDADQVVAVKDDFTKGLSAPDVTISTGSNALINQASITDVDTTGRVAYVGGQHYSDDILFQAELVKPAGETLGGGDQQHVAYEAVAFMDDHPNGELAHSDDHAVASLAPQQNDLVGHDVMHGMLA